MSAFPESRHLTLFASATAAGITPARPSRAAAAERLLSPERSYRTWSREEKERIVGETFAAGANVSAIALSWLDPSQLFAW